MSLNGTSQSHITVCHFFFLLIGFYHITHSHSPHVCLISFPFSMFCFISFHLTSLSFPSPSSHIRFPLDGSSLSGHVSRCNLCERTSGCTQMTFRSGVEICWKPVAFWGPKLWLALRLQGPRRCHLVLQTWGVALLDLVVGMATCWLFTDSPRVSFQLQQLYKSKVVVPPGAGWNSMGCNWDWPFEQ